ncbi:hypothetical protein GCM10028808_67520 [Spirosoma migulaei]
MQDIELINLWKSYSQKLDDSLALNRKNAEDLTKIKVQSLLASMKPLKLFTLLVGILWVIFVDSLLIVLFPFVSPFFLVSAAIQVLLTKLAIGIYLYQLILIQQVDISEPIIKTQDTLARLTASTLWVTRLLFLQLPVWTTFYLTTRLVENGTGAFYLVQSAITLAFTILAIWLFRNINYANRDKQWFKLVFEGKEWSPVMKSMELLNQIEAYKTGTH